MKLASIVAILMALVIGLSGQAIAADPKKAVADKAMDKAKDTAAEKAKKAAAKKKMMKKEKK